MAHSTTSPATQPNTLPENDLVNSIINILGGKEITGEEKIKIENEIARQEEMRERAEKGLSWYNKN